VNQEALMGILLSLRAASEANARAIDAAICLLGGDTVPEVDGPCQHPEDKRIKIPTMGGEDSWYCGICGYVEEVNGDGQAST